MIFIAYRHGAEDNRAAANLVPNYNGRGNIIYFDGHVGSTLYSEAIKGGSSAALVAGFDANRGIDMP